MKYVILSLCLYEIGVGSYLFFIAQVTCWSVVCSSTIRDKLIPHAVSWFTGEAVQGNEYDGLEGDFDDSDDEDGDDEEDEDGDKEEDEEDEEEEGKGKKKVNSSLTFH